jgi:S1-C subfamily serine protease
MPTLVVINSPKDVAQSGLRVVAVDPLSPAAQAGFRVGQILLSLNGQATQDVETARSIIAQNQGKPIPAIVLDGSTLLTLVVTPRAGDLGIDLCSVALCV